MKPRQYSTGPQSRHGGLGIKPLGASNLFGVIGFGLALIDALLIIYLRVYESIKVPGDKPDLP